MRVSNRCHAVTGLGYSTPWCVNAGFIAGEETTLIVDTGANTLAAASVYGYAMAVRPSNRLEVINTEKHFDHIGGNAFFRNRGIDVSGHAMLHRTEEEFQAEIAEFNEGIANPARRARSEAKVFYHSTSLANPNRPIASDTTLDLGNCPIEIILTPGHTQTNLSVWVPQDEVLFTGDCLINGYWPNLDAGASADWRTWLQSLDRIAALRPKAVIAGHGPVAEGNEVSAIISTVRQILEESILRGHSPTQPPQNTETTFACDPRAFTAEERKNHTSLTRTIFSSIEERRELADGYAFRVSPALPLSTAAAWVELEAKCCPFFDFRFEQAREQGALWIHLTGAPGVKPFILAEFNLR